MNGDCGACASGASGLLARCGTAGTVSSVLHTLCCVYCIVAASFLLSDSADTLIPVMTIVYNSISIIGELSYLPFGFDAMLSLQRTYAGAEAAAPRPCARASSAPLAPLCRTSLSSLSLSVAV